MKIKSPKWPVWLFYAGSGLVIPILSDVLPGTKTYWQFLLITLVFVPVWSSVLELWFVRRREAILYKAFVEKFVEGKFCQEAVDGMLTVYALLHNQALEEYRILAQKGLSGFKHPTVTSPTLLESVFKSKLETLESAVIKAEKEWEELYDLVEITKIDKEHNKAYPYKFVYLRGRSPKNYLPKAETKAS